MILYIRYKHHAIRVKLNEINENDYRLWLNELKRNLWNKVKIETSLIDHGQLFYINSSWRKISLWMNENIQYDSRKWVNGSEKAYTCYVDCAS